MITKMTMWHGSHRQGPKEIQSHLSCTLHGDKSDWPLSALGRNATMISSSQHPARSFEEPNLRPQYNEACAFLSSQIASVKSFLSLLETLHNGNARWIHCLGDSYEEQCHRVSPVSHTLGPAGTVHIQASWLGRKESQTSLLCSTVRFS